jgi:hypothetical protein
VRRHQLHIELVRVPSLLDGTAGHLAVELHAQLLSPRRRRGP